MENTRCTSRVNEKTQPRTVINENTGPQTKYRKVQNGYKNTGIYRTAETLPGLVRPTVSQYEYDVVWKVRPEQCSSNCAVNAEANSRKATTRKKFCLQGGGVSEGFTHKMAAWKFCLQDGGVSESLECILHLQCRIHLLNVTWPVAIIMSTGRHYNDYRSTVKRWT